MSRIKQETEEWFNRNLSMMYDKPQGCYEAGIRRGLEMALEEMETWLPDGLLDAAKRIKQLLEEE